MTYKHRDIVIAYKDGEQIQYRAPDGSWINLRKVDPELGLSCCFGDSWEYRIKPETKKYRVAYMKHPSTVTGYTASVDNIIEEEILLDNSDFIRWLTDWVEYEV